MQGCGWFDEDVKFSSTGFAPFSEVIVEGWRNGWSDSTRVDLQYYLEDVCEELELSGQIYTQEWYYAKVCLLYFQDAEIPDVAMTIGILLSQMWWKLEQETAALRRHESISSLNRANQAKKLRMKELTSAKIGSFWHYDTKRWLNMAPML